MSGRKPYAGYDPSLPKSVIKISYPTGEEISIEDLVNKKIDEKPQERENPLTAKVNDILSRLTRKEYEGLKNEFLDVTRGVTDLNLIIQPIFESALSDSNFLDLYIDLVKSLENKDAIKALLDKCQDEFEQESPASKSL